MNDSDRVYPVAYHFLHHSTGSFFVNASDLEVQDWFSNIGKARGYNNGAINSRHEHPGRPGQLTYAMAHFALREYTLDGNKYGWRLTDLIARPYQNVAWAVGNWFYNQRGVSTEVCGDYRGRELPDKACMLLADYMRPIDQELGGALQVWLHSEVFATECPAGIANQRNKIVDMINNPDKWNAILWPPTPPKPVITTKDVTEVTDIPFPTENVDDNTLPKGERQTKQEGKMGKRTVVTRITYTDGKETKREVVSDTRVEPVPRVILIGTYEAPEEPEIPEEPTPVDNPFVVFLEWLIKQIKTIWNKEK